jgi:hypothetical protein
MPTYIKTGYWDKKAKAPDGWLDLNLFVQTIAPPAPPSTNIYNSDGTLTGNRQLNGNSNNLVFVNVNSFEAYNNFFTINANNSYIDLINNDIRLNIDGANNILKTTNQGNDIGLKLDFANSTYQFGEITGSDPVTLNIEGAFDGQLYVTKNGLIDGLSLNFGSRLFELGSPGLAGNQTKIAADDFSERIYTSNRGDINGIDLNFNAKIFRIGGVSGSNPVSLSIFNDFSKTIVTSDGSGAKGLKLDFANRSYIFGQFNGNNFTYLQIDDVNQALVTLNNGFINGLRLNFLNSIYQFGQINGGNATTLKIDDAAAFPVQVSGTNVTQNTSGAASGKFLKIKVDGVDYVIELKNPS